MAGYILDIEFVEPTDGFGKVIWWRKESRMALKLGAWAAGWMGWYHSWGWENLWRSESEGEAEKLVALFCPVKMPVRLQKDVSTRPLDICSEKCQLSYLTFWISILFLLLRSWVSSVDFINFLGLCSLISKIRIMIMKNAIFNLKSPLVQNSFHFTVPYPADAHFCHYLNTLDLHNQFANVVTSF